jgi:hypothetical protein
LSKPPALGAGGPRFKSGRPDQNISRVFFSLLKALLTQDSPVKFRQTGGLDSQVVLFQRVRRMKNIQKHTGRSAIERGQNAGSSDG